MTNVFNAHYQGNHKRRIVAKHINQANIIASKLAKQHNMKLISVGKI